MISVIFFVLICSKDTKTEMNTKKVAHDSLHCTLIFCPHNFNSLFYFFLYHCKFRSQGLFRISRDVNDHSVLVKPTKKYLPNFPTPKESWNRKFQTQQILRSSPSLKIQSTSTVVSFHPKFLYQKFSSVLMTHL